jgi:hypothetical protein
MQYTALVANGGTESGWINIGTDKDCNGLVALVTPGTLTSTTLTMQASLDGSTALTHQNYLGATFTVTCSANKWISIDPALYAGFPFVRIVTGAAEGADRTFTLIVREVS